MIKGEQGRGFINLLRSSRAGVKITWTRRVIVWSLCVAIPDVPAKLR